MRSREEENRGGGTTDVGEAYVVDYCDVDCLGGRVEMLFFGKGGGGGEWGEYYTFLTTMPPMLWHMKIIGRFCSCKVVVNTSTYSQPISKFPEKTADEEPGNGN